MGYIIDAPPGTATRWAIDEGWTREAHLLANLAEAASGQVQLRQRYMRPGVDAETAEMVRSPADSRAVPFDSMPLDEFDKRLAANYALGPSAEGYDVLNQRKGAM